MNRHRKKTTKINRVEVFIGWSGDRSRRLAIALRELIIQVLKNVNCFCSDTDISSGSDWRNELWKHLKRSFFGIFCITNENISKPWIHYEVGALEFAIKNSICPYCFDVNSALLTAPLEKHQAKNAIKEDTLKLLLDLNAKRQDHHSEINEICNEFEVHWSKFNNVLNQLMNESVTFPIGGASPFIGFPGDIGSTQKNKLHSSAHQCLDIVGHTLSGLLDENFGLNSIFTALKNGAVVRLIYLDPSSDISDQVLQINKRISEDFREKIFRSLKRANAIKYSLKERLNLTHGDANAIMQRFLPAVTSLHLYHHIQRADDVILVSEYSQSEEPGNCGPTREVHNSIDPKLFKFYAEEFERIWKQSRPIENIFEDKDIISDRSRILANVNSIKNIYNSVVNSSSDFLPYPKSLIIQPSMTCNNSCPNCYTHKSSHMTAETMSINLFESIIKQALEMKVTHIEISGGGEPLLHPKINDILDKALFAGNGNFSLGLLSNGKQIVSEALINKLLLLDYVRLSFTEVLSNDENAIQQFKSIISNLINKKLNINSKTRIGVKFLLTNNNSDIIENQTTWLLSKTKIDHIKIKSLRSEKGDKCEPSFDQIRKLEHTIAFLRKQYPNATKDIQVDTKITRVNPTSFQCWINPIMSVIDASGKVYLCCNYYEREDDLKIGELGTNGENSFQTFWGKADHLSKISNIPKASVCNSQYGVNCRLVNYQDVCERFLLGNEIAHIHFKGVYPGQEQTV